MPTQDTVNKARALSIETQQVVYGLVEKHHAIEDANYDETVTLPDGTEAFVLIVFDNRVKEPVKELVHKLKSSFMSITEVQLPPKC